MPYYAVAKGVEEGIYQSWPECELRVKGFKGARYKKFNNLTAAQEFIAASKVSQPPPPKSNCYKNGGLARYFKSDKTNQEYFDEGEKSPEAAGYVKDELSGYLKCDKIKQEKLNSEDFPSISKVRVKQEPSECLDYIPIAEYKDNIKKEIKNEEGETNLWIEDIADIDEELLLALSALDEYPESSEPKSKNCLPHPRQLPRNRTKVKRVKCGKYSFFVDDDSYIKIYIGGTCENVGNWNGLAGYGAWFGPKHPLNISEPATGRITSNIGDVEAALYALRTAKSIGIRKVSLHTGSEFLLNAISGWIYKWKRTGWRNQNGKIVENRKEFQQLDALVSDDDLDVKWCDCRNDIDAQKPMWEVNKLARDGMEEYLDMHPTKDSFNECFDFDFC